MSSRLHSEARQIIEKFKQERITALYHFTSINNLELIRDKGGLYSKQLLESDDCWPVPEPGGNNLSHDLDRANGNWDKISLNFLPHTPMAYRKKSKIHLCFFVISADVAYREGVVFTDSNAAGMENQRRGEGFAGINLVDFDAIRSKPKPWEKDGWFRSVQAEILVPEKIEFCDILKICFVSEASLNEGLRLWGNKQKPKFCVDPSCFSDTPPSDTVNFSHLQNIFLTDAHVTEETVEHVAIKKSVFFKKSCQKITIIAFVHACAGVKSKIIWKPCGVDNQNEFEKTSNYWHWPTISIDRLDIGNHTVEYWIENVKWATLDFEVRE